MRRKKSRRRTNLNRSQTYPQAYLSAGNMLVPKEEEETQEEEEEQEREDDDEEEGIHTLVACLLSLSINPLPGGFIGTRNSLDGGRPRLSRVRAVSPRPMMRGMRPPACTSSSSQGLALLHFSAQRKRFLLDNGYIHGLFAGCLGGV